MESAETYVDSYYIAEDHMPGCFDVRPTVVKKEPNCTVDESEVAVVDYKDPSEVNIRAINAYGDSCYEDIVIAVCEQKVIFARLPVTACEGCTNAMCSMLSDLIQTTFSIESKIWVHHIKPSRQNQLRPEILYLGDGAHREATFQEKFIDPEIWHSSWDRYFPGPHHEEGDSSEDVVAVIHAPRGSANNLHDSRIDLAITIKDNISQIKPRLRANWNN